MSKKPKKYWRIQIEQQHEVVFRRWLPGRTSNQTIATILQRLACRDLSAQEIIASSMPTGSKVPLLDVRLENPPKAKRALIYLINLQGYMASLWLESEMVDQPEIDLLPGTPF